MNAELERLRADVKRALRDGGAVVDLALMDRRLDRVAAAEACPARTSPLAGRLSRAAMRERIAAELAERPADSFRAIARRLGCDHTTVARVARRITPAGVYGGGRVVDSGAGATAGGIPASPPGA